MAGWTVTSSCDDGSLVSAIRLDAGETVTCTFTNTKQGSIVVNKQTVPASSSPSFSFVSSYGSGSFSLSGGGTNTSGLLDVGTYSVAETPVAGWTVTSSCDDGSLVSAIRLDAGETVTCTFTNTKQGSIVVKKVTVPASSSPSFAFVSSYGSGSFSLSGGGTNTSGLLDAGTYSVAETPVAGWTVTSSCDDGSLVSAIRLDAGETVTCTFTNTGVPHLTITKTKTVLTTPRPREATSTSGSVIGSPTPWS